MMFMSSFYLIASLVLALILMVPITVVFVISQRFRKRMKTFGMLLCVFVGIFLLLVSLGNLKMRRDAKSKFRAVISETIPLGISNIRADWTTLNLEDYYCVFHFSCTEEAFNTLIKSLPRDFVRLDGSEPSGNLLPPRWREIVTQKPVFLSYDTLNRDIFIDIYYAKESETCIYEVIKI